MKTPQFLISRSDSGPWLDGYNGGTEWEWTDDRKRAWHMKEDEARTRLLLVQKIHPAAKLENAKQTR